MKAGSGEPLATWSITTSTEGWPTSCGGRRGAEAGALNPARRHPADPILPRRWGFGISATPRQRHADPVAQPAGDRLAGLRCCQARRRREGTSRRSARRSRRKGSYGGLLFFLRAVSRFVGMAGVPCRPLHGPRSDRRESFTEIGCAVRPGADGRRRTKEGRAAGQAGWGDFAAGDRPAVWMNGANIVDEGIAPRRRRQTTIDVTRGSRAAARQPPSETSSPQAEAQPSLRGLIADAGRAGGRWAYKAAPGGVLTNTGPETRTGARLAQGGPEEENVTMTVQTARSVKRAGRRAAHAGSVNFTGADTLGPHGNPTGACGPTSNCAQRGCEGRQAGQVVARPWP